MQLTGTATITASIGYVCNPKSAAQAYPLSVAAEKGAVRGVVTGRGTTRMIVVGDSYFLANDAMQLVANRDFADKALNWLLDREDKIGIAPKEKKNVPLTLDEQQLAHIWLWVMVILPGIVAIFGVFSWWQRRS